MHLGNVFSAMAAWLCVRKEKGTMLLRIEDLDPARCKEEYALQLKDDLRWLGLNWDEEQTPQSQRDKVYREVFESLWERNLVYPCYCSRDALHGASAPHASDGTVIYAGTCRNLTEQERALQTKAPAYRLSVPDETWGFTDLLQGKYEENLQKECGDFIIRRADGVAAYQLAVVVDDMAGGVSQVVRGRDLLTSTPRQKYLYSLLGGTAPEYLHVPLLTDESGRRLSKRDGDLDLGELRKSHSAEEILGTLAYSWGILEHFEKISAEELVGEFSLQKVKKENIAIRNFLV
ncbi:MAG: tRNA glutamyl-Q(34) synthetase GluQRS [Oscillospiraceae bacterium]|nr:tRNA glutamyl-Q(34) synthetase GluQRS [Oscillospiraceae bacterium]